MYCALIETKSSHKPQPRCHYFAPNKLQSVHLTTNDLRLPETTDDCCRNAMHNVFNASGPCIGKTDRLLPTYQRFGYKTVSDQLISYEITAVSNWESVMTSTNSCTMVSGKPYEWKTFRSLTTVLIIFITVGTLYRWSTNAQEYWCHHLDGATIAADFSDYC